ncbi:MAG: aminopeptidase [Erysipelotrichaceae bacterium]|nr:aminopeptidase [Erysipelotrichaceae bacterium]
MNTVWEKLTAAQLKELNVFCEDYRQFLSASKTERMFVKNGIEAAEKAGFRDISTFTSLKAGDRVYANNRGKNLCLFVIGTKPLTEGMNIVGAHIDSPRIDLKPVPLYEKDGLALLDTHYYGGIKKYQWVARPLALVGVVCKKDGTTVDINIGDKPGDPVLGISDLLPHLAQEQMKKPGATVVEGEALDALVGSRPLKNTKEEAVKKAVLKILKEQYDIEEDDFMSAELELVPAGEVRDYGLDRSMLLGYGHDDRVCGYTSMRAIMDMKKPERTSCCILVDKEEIGSVGNTGMHSRFFFNAVTRLLALQGSTSLIEVNDTFENSRMLSSDVSVAFDPNYPEVSDPKNTGFFGKGICFVKYTGSRGKGGANDANAEFLAKVRRVMDDNKVSFQLCELSRVDVGGGGTIAYILANLNMDVLDAGIAVQSMHAPFETVSKADVYEGYRCYKAFLKDMD